MEESETKDNARDEAGSGTTPTPEAPATSEALEGTPAPATPEGAQTMEEDVLIRKKKRHHSRRKKILKRVAIVAGILVAIAVVIAIAAFAFMKSGESAVKQANTADNIQADDSAVTVKKHGIIIAKADRVVKRSYNDTWEYYISKYHLF